MIAQAASGGGVGVAETRGVLVAVGQRPPLWMERPQRETVAGVSSVLSTSCQVPPGASPAKREDSPADDVGLTRRAALGDLHAAAVRQVEPGVVGGPLGARQGPAKSVTRVPDGLISWADKK